MKKNLFFFLLFFVATFGMAQNISLESDSILIGDQVTLNVSGSNYPTLDDLNQNGIIAVRQWFDTTAGTNNAQQITQKTLLTCFDEGEHWLKIGNDSLLLIVNDVPNVDTASTDIRDINGIMKEPYTFWEIFRWILLTILVAGIAYGIYYVIKCRKANKPIIALPKAPPLPPDTQALQDLEALRQRQLWQQGLVKDYHTELTDIVRNYLEHRFGIASTEMTSNQTVEQFEMQCLKLGTKKAETTTMLNGILQTADMVKFAKSEPLPYEHDKSMNDAITFIKTAEADLKQHEAEKTAAQSRKEGAQ